MNKTSVIDLSEDRLLSIASDYIDAHNLTGALKMLNKNAEINGNGEEAYMMYAEIFDDMQLYEKSINGWFKYLDYTDCADPADAYEGLAVCFLNMGQENFAAYYYNKLLIETSEELTPSNRQEIIDAFLTNEKNPLKIAYPPRLADFSEEIEKGIDFMRANDYDSAISQFDKVDEGNEKHLTARNYIAMCKIISDQCEEAEAECLAILEKYPDDVQALTTLAAVKTQQQKSGESRALAQKLLSLNATATDDIYKIATVCCENGMHDEAYRLFCKLEEELSYDSSVLYFKAVSAYNSGRIEKSLDAFDKLLTIYPDAVIAKFYNDYVKAHADGKDYAENPLSYFYRLPQEQREANVELLTAFSKLSAADAKKLTDELDISDCILWCFDEGDGRSVYELEMLGVTCAVKAGFDDMVRDILLDADVSDAVKMQTIGILAERNRDNVYGVVVCNIYRSVTLLALEIGRTRKKNFVKAYSALVSRFAMLDGNYVYLLNAAATKLYYKLAELGRLDDAKNINTLSAAIYRLSDIHDGGLGTDSIPAFFGADEELYRRLIGEE